MSANYPIGLYNFSYNCYMNSLLQCLYYCRDFRNEILKMKINEPYSMQMCVVLKGLMEGLKNCKVRSFNPKKIKNELNNYELFKNGKEADVTDLLDQIFYSVISEIKNEDTSCDTIRYENRLDSKSAMFEDIKKDIDFSIVINKLFLGFYEKEFKCEINKYHKKYSFQNEYRIVFPLEEIYKFYNNKENLTLDDCFSYNYKNKIKNFERCYKCTSHFNLIEKIYQTPRILIIILDRGPNKKFQQTIEFEEYLNLKDYVDDDSKGNRNEFKLIGVITHFGNSGSSGHYISYCLCDDNNYYCFNDSSVSIITEKGKKVDISSLYNGSAYVLFYQKLKPDEKKIFLFNKKSQDYPNNLVNLSKLMLEKIYIICNKYHFNIESHKENEYTWKNGRQKSIVVIFNEPMVILSFKYKCCETNLNNKFYGDKKETFNVKLEYNEEKLKSILSFFEEKSRQLFYK